MSDSAHGKRQVKMMISGTRAALLVLVFFSLADSAELNVAALRLLRSVASLPLSPYLDHFALAVECSEDNPWRRHDINHLEVWIQQGHPRALGSVLARCSSVQQANDLLRLLSMDSLQGHMTKYFSGLVLYKSGELERASKYWEGVPNIGKRARSLAHRELHETGNLRLALEMYRVSETVDPSLRQDKALAYMDLCKMYVDLNDLKQGEKYCRDLVDVAGPPQLADAHLLLARVYSAAGDWKTAIREYEIVVALHPYSASAHYYFGLALEESGMIDRARDEYKRSAQADPHYSPARSALARLSSE